MELRKGGNRKEDGCVPGYARTRNSFNLARAPQIPSNKKPVKHSAMRMGGNAGRHGMGLHGPAHEGFLGFLVEIGP